MLCCDLLATVIFERTLIWERGIGENHFYSELENLS